ncbi:hypothetical protein LXA43DRAFT_1103933 [Ganoderma leucocontextum]|nr:hypothetical protein LXA43DRAFT_1103933 [Ganoderma leucocontextum]
MASMQQRMNAMHAPFGGVDSVGGYVGGASETTQTRKERGARGRAWRLAGLLLVTSGGLKGWLKSLDGLVYFVVLLVVNTLDLLFSVLPAFNVAVNVNFMLQLIQPLTSILISHFLLDLQEAYRRTLRLNSDDPLYTEASIGGDQQLGSLNFAHVVGSLGAVIDHSATGEDLVVGEDE